MKTIKLDDWEIDKLIRGVSHLLKWPVTLGPNDIVDLNPYYKLYDKLVGKYNEDK